MGYVDVALVVDAHSLNESDCRRVLVPALAAVGLNADLVAWDDPALDWSGVRGAVVRATWDYHLRVEEFLGWVERAAKATCLWNPAAAIQWNARKTYLRDLEARGIATIPTIWLKRGEQVDLAQALHARGWARAVVKPVVSASAYQTVLVSADTVAEGGTHLARLLADRDAMIQPYIETVTTSGEHSLVFVGGQLTHAVRRAPVLDACTEHHGAPALIPAEPEEEAFARTVLRAAGFDTLYARVDMIRDSMGTLRLMELELIEPSLWLGAAPWAAERLAREIARRLPMR